MTIDTADIQAEGKRLIAEEWIAQGHNLSGAFIEAIQSEVEQSGGNTIISWYDTTERGYGAILNRGVTHEKIPFSPGSGAKTSKYIAGLFRYVKLRMAVSDDKQALGIAFAIAYKHKKEGMPTKDSAIYSSTGRRIGFIEDMEPKLLEAVERMILIEV